MALAGRATKTAMALPDRATKRDYTFSQEDQRNMLDAVEAHQEDVNAWGLNANKIKAKAWREIAAYVNEQGERKWPFSGMQCRVKYRGLSGLRTQERREEKKSTKVTGGGAGSKSKLFTQADVRVLDAGIAPEKINGIVGGLDAFDDTLIGNEDGEEESGHESSLVDDVYNRDNGDAESEQQQGRTDLRRRISIFSAEGEDESSFRSSRSVEKSVTPGAASSAGTGSSAARVPQWPKSLRLGGRRARAHDRGNAVESEQLTGRYMRNALLTSIKVKLELRGMLCDGEWGPGCSEAAECPPGLEFDEEENALLTTAPNAVQ